MLVISIDQRWCSQVDSDCSRTFDSLVVPAVASTDHITNRYQNRTPAELCEEFIFEQYKMLQESMISNNLQLNSENTDDEDLSLQSRSVSTDLRISFKGLIIDY
ncbi:hypothetical protein CEXT_591841 [Caerostris extrusa]|uniref:Uncharacterized protein n=1 Tax=Caerostris extrusa TaxID=172846 RepID=A0AAV4W9K9_CAEEX|nr:hypothetical protein CEXT_591841 [Caerostris extrusa]